MSTQPGLSDARLIVPVVFINTMQLELDPMALDDAGMKNDEPMVPMSDELSAGMKNDELMVPMSDELSAGMKNDELMVPMSDELSTGMKNEELVVPMLDELGIGNTKLDDVTADDDADDAIMNDVDDGKKKLDDAGMNEVLDEGMKKLLDVIDVDEEAMEVLLDPPMEVDEVSELDEPSPDDDGMSDDADDEDSLLADEDAPDCPEFALALFPEPPLKFCGPLPPLVTSMVPASVSSLQWPSSPFSWSHQAPMGQSAFSMQAVASRMG